MSRFSSLLAPGLVLTAALVGCNSAPIAPVVTIEPTEPTTVDPFELVFLARSEDPDLADTVTYDIQWYRDGEELTDLSGATSVSADLTAKAQVWQVIVTPIDSEGEVGQAAEAVVTVANTPPTASVEVLPAEPGSYEDLLARPTGQDLDGDEITYSYVWLRNGEVMKGMESNQIPAAETAKGDLWTVQLTPNDGDDDGETVEATVSVGNALPIATAVTIEPVLVREDTVIEAFPEGSDEDGDPLTWTFTWYVNDEALPGESGATLDGASFDKGDRIVVEAVPNDGLADGEGVRSAPVRVRNSAPTLGGAAIDPSEAYEASTLACLGSGFNDIDGDPEGYRTAWFVNGARFDTDTLDGSRFSKGDSVYCELSPFDGTEAGDFVRTDTIVVLNTAPVLTRATITNSSPREGDTLDVRIEGAGDDDGDTVSFEYSWTVDGTEVATTPTLSSDLFDKGESVQVTITPFDGTDRGVAVTSAAVIVENTPPVMDSVSLSPTDLRTNDTLTATVASSDVDGDTVTYDFAWYVDGVKIGATGATLDGSAWFAKGEEVWVVVTPNDGDDDGASMTSSKVEVKNTKPEISAATIAPSTVKEETEITCVPSGWTDDDGDTESYKYVWYVEGRSVGATAKLDGDFFDRGEEVWCEITPFDGEEDGTTVTSSRVTIANTAPTIARVELSTTSPKEGDSVYAIIIGDDDVDGDDIDFSYEWYVDGSRVSTDDEIDSSLFAKGDSVYVVVTPSDDADTGVGVKSNTGTVANTAPVVSAVSLAPTSPKTTDGVTATVTATDVDGDSISYAYAWYVDGKKVSSTGATLSTTDFLKNQTIYVEVTPTDGDDAGTAFRSGTITSVNTPPSITGVSVVPGSGITESSTLTCTPAGWSDADGDTEGYAWQWRVGGRLVAVTKTLAGTFFSKGDSITCTATPNDGEDLGTAITSSAVSVDNTPPVLSSVTLSTSTPQEGDTIRATLGSATDADGDRISYSYSWRVNGTEVSTAATLDGDDFDKGDTIELLVTPSDGTDDGTAVSSGVVTAVNTVPVISSVSLSPTSPKTTDAVSASVVSTDADGDSVTYTYAWTVNGTGVSASGASLPSSAFKKGDTIAVTVTPSDGDGSGTAVASATITAVNTPPVLASVSLSPSTFGESDTVTCVPSGFTDADGDSASYSYAWKVNGSYVSATTSTLTGSSFDKSDSVQCEITPNDGTDDGATVASAVVRVGNAKPVLSSATITPSSPKEKDVLTVTLGSATDADGDTITYKYSWSVGGTAVATTPTLNGSRFDKGDVVTVTVTPNDGTDDGTQVTSSSVTIANTAPVISAVTLSPSSPGTDTLLTAAVTAADDDGESLTYSYDWYVGGTKVSATGASLDGKSFFDKGDSVYVVVTADDGDDTSAAFTSAAVTVGNTPPTIASATISPSTIREATTVSCTGSGWSDTDGDSEGYRYSWTVNGASVSTSTTLTGASFKKGDTVGCVLTPFDGTDTGTAVSASTVKVQNTAPELTSVSLSTLSPTESTTLSATLGSATDADGDTISYTYAWYVGGRLVSSATTLDGTSFSSGDSIYLEVTPTDGDDDGTTVRSATATVANTAPVISSVTLSPTSPRTNDSVTATASATDADGDSLTYTYAWTVNGVAVSGVTGPTLSGTSHFDKGEEIQVTVTVTDGTTPVSRTSGKITVANTPPVVSAATISATSLKEGDSVSCSPGRWSDADGDTAGYRYAWLVGGTVVSGATTSTLTSASFSSGDSVQCRITPWDGDDEGTPVFSATATVLNTAPVAGGVTLSNTSPRTTDTVTATVTGVSDADGDTVSLRYQWYVGGSLRRTTTTTSRSNSLSPSEFVKNQAIYVVVTPNDGKTDGSSVTSATASSVNSAPVISGVTLSPSTVRTSNTITASTSVSDADGDSLTYTYTWYHQNEGSGSFSTVGSSGSTLSSSLFDKGDVVYAEVRVSDGTTTSGPVASSRITIANTAPTRPGVSLSPSSPADTQSITCSGSGGSDVDGDSLTYGYWWYRNGSYYTFTRTSGSTTISSSVTRGGDTWRCEVATWDGTDYSSRNSTSVSVRSSLSSWSGPRTSVSAGSLSGWSVCWSDRYHVSGTPMSTIWSRCNRTNLMYACRPVGASSYNVAAHGNRSSVLRNTGTGNSPTNHNGTGWYYSDSWSMGFARQGDGISRGSCDTGGSNTHLRLCFHTRSRATLYGWSCGSNRSLNSGSGWEKVILHAN